MKNLLASKKIHMIGIKGAGMAALAEILVKHGIAVTGSDTEEIFFTDAILGRLNIPVREGFDPSNIPSDVDAIIYSTAYDPKTNQELDAAVKSEKKTISYPEALGELMQDKMGLAVCGTHGKTTTSALLSEALRIAGEDPLAVVGSHILQWEGNALAGSGKYFVLEADEYQNKFQYYFPFGMILTSVDWDHPDFFPTFESYKQAFVDLVRKIPHHGTLVFWGDSAIVRAVAEEAHCKKLSYGFLEENDFRLMNYRVEQMAGDTFPSSLKQSFEIFHEEASLGVFSLQLAGRHNALNAAAVIALCTSLGVDVEKVREGLNGFSGTARRFEYIGRYHDAPVYDDYAHHPEEIKATLRAFRELYPESKLKVIFHPHTYTRTKALLAEFSQSFDDADEVVILDIYGSAREQQGGVSSQELVELINKYTRQKAVYIPNIADVLAELKERTEKGDVIVTLGAGNVWEISHGLVKG